MKLCIFSRHKILIYDYDIPGNHKILLYIIFVLEILDHLQECKIYENWFRQFVGNTRDFSQIVFF